MPNLVSDGEKHYLEANWIDLQKVYEQRVAGIRGRYITSARVNILERGVQYVAMRRDMARAKREIFGKDNLYLFNLSSS
jgi:hypothetical protein